MAENFGLEDAFEHAVSLEERHIEQGRADGERCVLAHHHAACCGSHPPSRPPFPFGVETLEAGLWPAVTVVHERS
jgi:hypothetical protein